jgi:hypothetical protein
MRRSVIFHPQNEASAPAGAMGENWLPAHFERTGKIGPRLILSNEALCVTRVQIFIVFVAGIP